MAYRVKNFGGGRVRFNEGIIVSGSNDTALPRLRVSGSAYFNTETENNLFSLDANTGQDVVLEFMNNGTQMSKITQGSGGNLVIQNVTSNKDIILQANDGGTIREALRINGDALEVVINEGSESLVDFRVESNGEDEALYIDGSANTLYINKGATGFTTIIKNNNEEVIRVGAAGAIFNEYGHASNNFRIESDNNTHMVFVDSGNDKVGINTDAPVYTLDVAGDMGVNEYIYHNGDSDTFIKLEDDEINIEVGGRQMIKFVEASTDKITINNGGNDIDLQIKGADQANLIRTDAANDRVGIAINAPTSTFEVNGSIARSISAKTSDYTATESDYTLLINATSNNVTISLPSAVGAAGRIYVFKRADGSGNTAVVSPDGSETIDGSNSNLILGLVGEAVTLQSDGSGWHKIGDYLPPPP